MSDVFNIYIIKLKQFDQLLCRQYC